MDIIEPSFFVHDYPKDVLRNIEMAARNCYKSNLCKTHAERRRFVERLIKNGHYAMIEFGGDVVVEFFSNRGFTHQLVRHRHASFAQESTRYCNYAKKKFNGVQFCDPSFVLGSKISDENKIEELSKALIESWEISEQHYMRLIKLGAPSDIAREVLPIGASSTIFIKANVREWRHVLSLRCSRRAHPRMRELMVPLLYHFNEIMPVVFEDIAFEVQQKHEDKNG